MTNGTRYTASQRVVHEAFDDEIILVNLESGHYYTLAGSAAAIWRGITGGALPHDVARLLSTQHRGEPADIAAAVEQFVAELEHERLIVAADGTADATTPDAAATVPAESDEQPVFEPPVLVKYTDMETLLILDPIHDVDESGWPNVAPTVPPSTTAAAATPEA